MDRFDLNKLKGLKLDGIKLDGIRLDDLKFVDAATLNKLAALVRKQEEEEVKEEKKCHVWLVILAILGVIAVGCVIGYVLYNRFKPEYLDEFDEEFGDEDEFEDSEDFFVDEGEE